MINWFDMPAEGLSNGGLFEVKELEVTENGTYETKGEMYNKVTVNVEGGGGSWQTVFEGSVETVDDGGEISGIVGTFTLTVDSIKATLNGTEYILPKTEHGYGAENESGLDFSTYPLFIAVGDSDDSYCVLWTPTAGTYTLKIEEPQSGGSSDFSTAEVVISGATGEEATVLLMPNIQDSDRRTGIEAIEVNASPTQKTYNVPLYKGHCLIKVNSGDVDNLTDNVTLDRGWLDVTGNCGLTGYYVQRY